MDDLEVNSELTTTIVEDEDADGTTARLEGVAETSEEVGLVNDGEALLDIAGLGHGDDVAVSDVEDAVLLEDRAEHGLDNNAGSRVGDEGGLLMQLLGEEVNTKVAVLAGGRRGRDADDLARSALEHQEVTQADVVAGDGDGVGGVAVLRGTLGTASVADLNIDVIMAVGNNLVSQLVDAGAEGVVVTCTGAKLASGSSR